MDNTRRILQLKQGDRKAFELVYKTYWGKVYNFALLYLSDKNDAEEVVQEVFITLWEKRKNIDTKRNFEGYLFIITRNAVFNMERDKHNEVFIKYSALEALEEEYADATSKFEKEDLKNFIRILIDQLPKRQREVFLLSRKEKKTYREIAEKLNISEKTVEKHMGKALSVLKNNLLMLSLFLSI